MKDEESSASIGGNLNNINDSNKLVVEIDKPVEKDPIKIPKNKVFKEMPIEESQEQFEIIESKSLRLRIKICLNYLDKIDKKISKPLQAYTPNLAIELIFYFFAKLFNTYLVISYMVSLLIYSYMKNKYNIFFIVFSHVIISVIFTVILKKLIGRNRPSLNVKRYFNNVNIETNKSMPSGDAIQAGTFSTMAILYIDYKLKYLFLLIVPGVLCGRVFYNCHYWFDCIIGLLLGIFISIGVYFIIIKIQLYYNL